MVFKFKDEEYEMRETLRVAYAIQTANGHKPYSKVFAEMGDMPIESQIGVLYVSFNLQNPNVATKQEFLDYCLDNYGLDGIMEKLTELMDGIMYFGLSPEEKAAKKAKEAAEREKAKEE